MANEKSVTINIKHGCDPETGEAICQIMVGDKNGDYDYVAVRGKMPEDGMSRSQSTFDVRDMIPHLYVLLNTMERKYLEKK